METNHTHKEQQTTTKIKYLIDPKNVNPKKQKFPMVTNIRAKLLLGKAQKNNINNTKASIIFHMLNIM